MTQHTTRPLSHHSSDRRRLLQRCLADLEPSRLYTSSDIVDQGERNGWLSPEGSQQDRRREKARLHLMLEQLATQQDFPPTGDGLIELPGQAPIRGWYGERWYQAAPSATGQ